MKMGRRTRVGLAALAGIALACGTAGTAVSQDGKYGGKLVAAFAADPGGFDPARGPSGM